MTMQDRVDNRKEIYLNTIAFMKKQMIMDLINKRNYSECFKKFKQEYPDYYPCDLIHAFLVLNEKKGKNFQPLKGLNSINGELDGWVYKTVSAIEIPISVEDLKVSAMWNLPKLKILNPNINKISLRDIKNVSVELPYGIKELNRNNFVISRLKNCDVILPDSIETIGNIIMSDFNQSYFSISKSRLEDIYVANKFLKTQGSAHTWDFTPNTVKLR